MLSVVGLLSLCAFVSEAKLMVGVAKVNGMLLPHVTKGLS